MSNRRDNDIPLLKPDWLVTAEQDAAQLGASDVEKKHSTLATVGYSLLIIFAPIAYAANHVGKAHGHSITQEFSHWYDRATHLTNPGTDPILK